MFARALLLVNLLACTEAVPQRPRPARTPGEMGISPARVELARAQPVRHGLELAKLPEHPPIGGRIGELELPPRLGLDNAGTPLTEIGAHLTDVYTGGGGEALEAALAELPARRVEQNGVAALTLDQLFGDTFHPGLCEDGILVDFVEFEGESWEMNLSVPTFMVYAGDIEPVMSSLTGSCQAAVADNGGDLAAAEGDGCIEDDIEQFFPDGSACRACVEGNGGDFDACVASEECYEEAPSVVWFEEEEGTVWYQLAQGYIFACAPDQSVLTYIAAKIGPEGELPAAFDHEAWSYLCIPYWDEEFGGVSFTCFAGEGGPEKGDAMLEGALGRVNYMRPEGDEGPGLHSDLMYYAHDITLTNGTQLNWFWGFSDGAGVFSMPGDEPDSNGNGVYDIEDENYGFGLGGWDINPLALRPDGVDPADVDDTQARDWLGAMAVKFSTTRDGVPISTYNHNRCAAWEGPFDDGTYRCSEMGLPTYGFQNDVQNTWVDSSFTQAYPMPVATLLSTGLPDPKIPGGIVTLVAGSPALADPDWDDCTWPDSFVPDLAPMEDTPGGYGGPASLWGHTWRFDKESELDFRFGLNTDQARGFCPEEG
jgi:hypothetical protein